MSGKTVMIVAGGTGGHLFPALALAHELKQRGWQADLVTDERARRFDAGESVRRVHQVPAATFRSRSPLAVIRTLVTLARGVAAAYRLLRAERPGAVAGFGGYPTIPPIIAARLARIPVAIHEQNAVMGRANRRLAPLAAAIALSFDNTRHLGANERKKARIVGTPVRAAVLAERGKAYKAPKPDEPFALLAFGGSQGARVLSETIPAGIARLPDALRQRLRVVQQCREEDLEGVRAAYADSGIEAELAAFFPDLPARIAAAHLVISRAGASTVAELAVIGRPAILVPLPHSLDNDQRENATRAEEGGGAWCLDQRAFTAKRVAWEIERLAGAPEELERAAQAAHEAGKAEAAANLADVIEDIARPPA